MKTTAAWPGPTHPTGPAGPGPSGPAGPNGPHPSGPAEPPIPQDDLMALADAVGVSQSARAGAGACRSLVPAVAAGGGRAGAASLGSGAVPKPTLPKPLGPPRFGGDDRPQPGQPGPQPDPTPYPPPAMPPVPPWVAARRRLAGFGPQYDVLPGVPR